MPWEARGAVHEPSRAFGGVMAAQRDSAGNILCEGLRCWGISNSACMYKYSDRGWSNGGIVVVAFGWRCKTRFSKGLRAQRGARGHQARAPCPQTVPALRATVAALRCPVVPFEERPLRRVYCVSNAVARLPVAWTLTSSPPRAVSDATEARFPFSVAGRTLPVEDEPLL